METCWIMVTPRESLGLLGQGVQLCKPCKIEHPFDRPHWGLLNLDRATGVWVDPRRASVNGARGRLILAVFTEAAGGGHEPWSTVRRCCWVWKAWRCGGSGPGMAGRGRRSGPTRVGPRGGGRRGG